MDNELFNTLEQKVESLLHEYSILKQEILMLKEENQRLLEEREGLKSRVDVIIKKLEGI